MERIILVDCDGVLVDWDAAFDQFMVDKSITRQPNADDKYNIAERYNISYQQGYDSVCEFNQSWRIEFLTPFKDSVMYVKKLAEHGFRFVVISSLGDNPSSKVRRVSNLKTLFGDVFDDIICIKQGMSKYDTLSKWAGTKYFWIEDHMRQAEAGYEVGLRPILIQHPYNSHYVTDLFSVVSVDNPWQQIYNIVTLDYIMINSVV